jgi:uncharacterized protein YkwD
MIDLQAFFNWLTGRRPAPPDPPLHPVDTSVPGALLTAHNAKRAAVGLPPLVFAASLQAMAESHAERMAAEAFMSHDGNRDGAYSSRLAASGYRYSGAAENVAEGSADAVSVVNQWMASPGHRANILGRYSDFGAYGALDVDGHAYWCAEFGQPMAFGGPPPAAPVKGGD